LARFGRFLEGESVGVVEDGVAIQKIYATVQSWGARFGGDLKPGAAGICEKRGVGILVDPHFLDGGRRDTRPVGFDAVDDQRDAVSGDGVVVQKAGECGDVVLIENGNAIEGGTFESVGALILRRVGGDLWGRIGPANSDGFGLRGKSKCDAQRRQAFSLESDGDRGVLEPRSGDREGIRPHGHLFEVKAAERVGFRWMGVRLAEGRSATMAWEMTAPEGSWTVPESVKEVDDDWESSELGRTVGESGTWKVCAPL